MNVYQIGSLARIENTFRDAAGALIDPTDNSLFVTTPATLAAPQGVTTEYVFGTDIEVVNDSQGVYHADIPITAGGLWLYKWVSTGSGQAAAQAALRVEYSDFTVPPPP